MLTVKSLTRSLRRQRSGAIGLAIVSLFVLVAVLAPFIAPHDPNVVALEQRLQSPSMSHLLGTDSLGRDVLSRLIYGARVSLLVGVLPALLSMVIGVVAGVVAGYFRGVADVVIMRFADVQLAFPFILLALTVLATLGGGVTQLILVLGIANWVSFCRIVRGEAMSIREREFVLSARAIGVGRAQILARHVLPNVLAPVLVVASFVAATNILIEASLSFLGLGVDASTPSWGSMLADGRDLLQAAWWVETFPGLAIVVTVLGINLFGDWLRDYLDPRLPTA